VSSSSSFEDSSRVIPASLFINPNSGRERPADDAFLRSFPAGFKHVQLLPLLGRVLAEQGKFT
jgi:hypothetical protein